MTSLQSLGSSFKKEFEPSLWTVVMHELPWVPINHLLQPQWFWISPRVSGREWIKQLHEAVAIPLPTASGFYDLSIAQFEICYGPHCYLSYPVPTPVDVGKVVRYHIPAGTRGPFDVTSMKLSFSDGSSKTIRL